MATFDLQQDARALYDAKDAAGRHRAIPFLPSIWVHPQRPHIHLITLINSSTSRLMIAHIAHVCARQWQCQITCKPLRLESAPRFSLNLDLPPVRRRREPTTPHQILTPMPRSDGGTEGLTTMTKRRRLMLGKSGLWRDHHAFVSSSSFSQPG